MRKQVVRAVSYKRHGRLTPRRSPGLRAGAVVLGVGEMIDWHSTRGRQELLIALAGRIQVELSPSARRRRRVRLRAGECAMLPPQTAHRVVNQSSTKAHYLYVTASIT